VLFEGELFIEEQFIGSIAGFEHDHRVRFAKHFFGSGCAKRLEAGA